MRPLSQLLSFPEAENTATDEDELTEEAEQWGCREMPSSRQDAAIAPTTPQHETCVVPIEPVKTPAWVGEEAHEAPTPG